MDFRYPQKKKAWKWRIDELKVGVMQFLEGSKVIRVMEKRWGVLGQVSCALGQT